MANVLDVEPNIPRYAIPRITTAPSQLPNAVAPRATGMSKRCINANGTMTARGAVLHNTVALLYTTKCFDAFARPAAADIIDVPAAATPPSAASLPDTCKDGFSSGAMDHMPTAYTNPTATLLANEIRTASPIRKSPCATRTAMPQ